MSKLRGFRRVASAMWDAPDDPQIYGSLELPAERLLRFIEEARALGHNVTPTHLVGRAVAQALVAVPELNVRIVGDEAHDRPSIDIFFIASVRAGQDLSGVKVEGVDKLRAVELAGALAARTTRMRTGNDAEFAKTKRLTDRLPRAALRALLKTTALLTQRFQLSLPRLGLHRSPFGSAMITSVGMFGIPHGFAPIAWMYDVPLLILVGEIAERPVVEDHQVVARPVIPLTATLDHRYVDGFHISKAMKAIKAYLADPFAYEQL